MVLVQKWPFFQLFFLANISRQNVFYDILERKNALLGYKNNNLKKSKNCHFFKGVNPWFWSKMAFFQLFFLGDISQENVFCDILQRKNACLGYKNNKFKKVEKLRFFQLFFLRNISRENVFYDILERKNPFLGYKNNKFKMVEKLTFLKRG